MTCFTTIRGKAARVTELDACGVPVPGGSFVVTDGFVSVSITTELESGDEFTLKNANGVLKVNERDEDSTKRLNVEVDWCEVNPDIVGLITRNSIEMDVTTPVGFRIKTGKADATYALEVWTGLAGAGTCSEEGVQYGYMLVPFITGSTLSGLTIENGAATFKTTGYTRTNSGWGVGPYDVIGTMDNPRPLDAPIVSEDLSLLRTTFVEPPEPGCEVGTTTSSPA